MIKEQLHYSKEILCILNTKGQRIYSEDVYGFWWKIMVSCYGEILFWENSSGLTSENSIYKS